MQSLPDGAGLIWPEGLQRLYAMCFIDLRTTYKDYVDYFEKALKVGLIDKKHFEEFAAKYEYDALDNRQRHSRNKLCYYAMLDALDRLGPRHVIAVGSTSRDGTRFLYFINNPPPPMISRNFKTLIPALLDGTPLRPLIAVSHWLSERGWENEEDFEPRLMPATVFTSTKDDPEVYSRLELVKDDSGGKASHGSDSKSSVPAGAVPVGEDKTISRVRVREGDDVEETEIDEVSTSVTGEGKGKRGRAKKKARLSGSGEDKADITESAMDDGQEAKQDLRGHDASASESMKDDDSHEGAQSSGQSGLQAGRRPRGRPKKDASVVAAMAVSQAAAGSEPAAASASPAKGKGRSKAKAGGGASGGEEDITSYGIEPAVDYLWKEFNRNASFFSSEPRPDDLSKSLSFHWRMHYIAQEMLKILLPTYLQEYGTNPTDEKGRKISIATKRKRWRDLIQSDTEPYEDLLDREYSRYFTELYDKYIKRTDADEVKARVIEKLRVARPHQLGNYDPKMYLFTKNLKASLTTEVIVSFIKQSIVPYQATLPKDPDGRPAKLVLMMPHLAASHTREVVDVCWENNIDYIAVPIGVPGKQINPMLEAHGSERGLEIMTTTHMTTTDHYRIDGRHPKDVHVKNPELLIGSYANIFKPVDIRKACIDIFSKDVPAPKPEGRAQHPKPRKNKFGLDISFLSDEDDYD